MVFGSSFDPAYIVMHLLLNFFRRLSSQLFQYFSSQLIGLRQILRITAGTYPTERTETVIETHRSHNILNIRRILEVAVRLQDIGTGTGRLQ